MLFERNGIITPIPDLLLEKFRGILKRMSTADLREKQERIYEARSLATENSIMMGSTAKRPPWLSSILKPPRTPKPVEVDPTVTADAERDQVLHAIVSWMASRLEVMNLQPSKRATELAAPGVAVKDLLSKLPIGN